MKIIFLIMKKWIICYVVKSIENVNVYVQQSLRIEKSYYIKSADFNSIWVQPQVEYFSNIWILKTNILKNMAKESMTLL